VAEFFGARLRRTDAFFWILRILLAALFLSEGVGKFPESRLWVRIFEEIGVGQWFRYFTGIVEIAGALMLLVPRATVVGVGLLVCTMIGALIVHVLVIGVGRQTMFVGVLLLMLLVVGIRHTTKARDRGRGITEAV
jgi:putative oxidoreductase